jgi:3,4-dihydroxybenzoate---[aryl-carrier protein] ligase
MIQINTARYDSAELNSIHEMYQGLEHLRHVEGKMYAVCSQDPLYIVSLVLYFREQAGSLLLIHGETPIDTALTMAVEANCDGLLYQDPKRYIPLKLFSEEENEAGLCQYSSGTTGQAKLIRRSWSEIQTELNAYNEALEADASGADIVPVVLTPVSHSYGLLSGVLSALDRGVEPIIVASNNPKYAWNVIQETPRHLVYGVPVLLQALAGLHRGHGRFHRLISSGAPMPEALFHRLSMITDGLLQQYGCTEAGCISLSNRMDASSDLGRPLGHIQLQTGKEPSGPEEIIVRINGKVLSTRDMGYLSDSGKLHFVSRADDVINVSGLKVYPSEVEDRIGLLHGIRETVVYRIQHPVIGEMVKAMVVGESSLTPELVREWCMQGLPPYKVPSIVECVATIPRTANGKISRRLLEQGEDV